MIDLVRDGAVNYYSGRVWSGYERKSVWVSWWKLPFQGSAYFDYTGTEGVVPAYENLKDIIKKVVDNSEQAIYAVRTDVDKLEAMKIKIF